MTNTAHAVRKISTAIDYLETHLPERLTLDMVANAVFCSKFHFHRLFAKSMGMTIHDYLQRRRLTEAARSLVYSESPILYIALAAGYESQQAFAGIFKALYKMPPLQFRRNAVFYPLQLPARVEGKYAMLENGMAGLEVRLATRDDIPAWMRLVRLVVDGYPCLCEDEYLEVLQASLSQNEAFICMDADRAAGVMIFSGDAARIEFMGVHPFYRDAGVLEAMLDRILSDFADGHTNVSTTTYRAGDKADTGHRNMLGNLGFVEAELLTEFGYPTQKFILMRNHYKRKRKR